MYRKEYTMREAVEADIHTLVIRTAHLGRRLQGMSSFSTAAVRALQIQGQQALPENRAHASIYMANPAVRQSVAKELRGQMLVENILTSALTSPTE